MIGHAKIERKSKTLITFKNLKTHGYRELE